MTVFAVCHEQVILAACASGEVQKWVFDSTDFTISLAATIRNPKTVKKCLSVQEGNTNRGTALMLEDCVSGRLIIIIKR